MSLPLTIAKRLLVEKSVELLTALADYDLEVGENHEKARQLSDKIDVCLEDLKSAKNSALKASLSHQEMEMVWNHPHL